MSKSDRVGRFMGKLAAARGKLDESSEAQNSFDAAHAAIGLLPRYRRVADIHQKRISALSAVVSITRRSRVAEPILFSAFPAADAPPPGGNGGSSESQGRDRRRAACGESTRARHWNRPCCPGRSIDLNTTITATIASTAKKETEAGKPDVQGATW